MKIFSIRFILQNVLREKSKYLGIFIAPLFLFTGFAA